ncbi:hypothetical protein HanRHA438_Chr15g0735221 [Helianthus annuus]|nr:hypothetical protein HanIR_Chr15g0786531 [Helianthus annuus]KAJ0847357.1 hypothetical protein HanRHA438_Chr15g0735221 [Helianthus annuus]
MKVLWQGRLANTKLTKEDYDQIDPEEMELIDIRWCMASAVRRAQRFMEITGRKSIGGPSTKLGFDKSKVTCLSANRKVTLSVNAETRMLMSLKTRSEKTITRRRFIMRINLSHQE